MKIMFALKMLKYNNNNNKIYRRYEEKMVRKNEMKNKRKK